MDTSFELLSSMSPKLTKCVKPPTKKVPTKLALKKYFRRSSLGVINTSIKDESVIIVESSSTETCSTSTSELNEAPVIISDSELSFKVKLTPENLNLKCTNKDADKDINCESTVKLSQEKYTTIKHWVEKVNSTNQDTSVFSEMSTIYGDGQFHINHGITKHAFTSTQLEPLSKQFHELFRKSTKHQNQQLNESNINKELNNSSKKIIEIDDSLFTEDNSKSNEILEIEDSLLQLKLDNTPLKSCSEVNENLLNDDEISEYGNLLDSLYGDSWREKKDDILPSSEPRPKTRNKVSAQIPKTERPTKKPNIYKNPYVESESNNLLKTLQKARFKKALESPWTKSLKKVCDSDTDSEDDCRDNLTPIKLDFKDNEKCNKKLFSSDSLSDSSLKDNVPIKTKKTTTASKTNKNKHLINKNKNKSEPECYSFLASLSSNVPMSKCDISALIFRNNFKEQKEQLSTKLFKLYNEKIFENAIPQQTPLEWNDRMRGTAGYCYCKKVTHRTGAIERVVRIVLSSKVLDSADRVRDTLVHEMCHAATWIVNQVADGHGLFWKSWADRAAKTFPELPPIKRCHQYVINTKYTYKCTDCGYSIGRHSKSLDIERKRCGYCYGKFEVFINKTTKTGEKKSVPATPKKLNGFAKFVKENYATHKTSDLKHADVMKILSQKFSNLKCDQS